MLYSLSLILMALSGVITTVTLIQVRMKRLRRPILYFFNIQFLLLFILVPLSVEFLGGAQTIRWHQNHLINQADVLSIYAMYVLIFSITCLLLVSSAQTRPVAPSGQSDAPYSEKLHGQYSSVLILVVAIGLIMYVVGTGMSLRQLLVASRFAWIDNPGGNALIVLLGLYLVSMIAPASFHIFVPNRTRILKVAALLALIVIMVAVSGGRKWVIFLISGYIAAKYFHGRSLKFSNFDSVTLSALVVLVVVWQFGRHLTEVSMNSITDLITQRGLELVLEGDISYFYRASLEAISLNINEGIWYPLSAVRRLLFLPIPDEFTFGLKPEGIPTSFARDIGATNSRRLGNMPPSMIGIFVLSFGAASGMLLFGMILPVILHKLDSFFLRRSILRDSLASYSVVVIVLFARGNISVLYYVVFYFIVFKLISVLLSILRGNRRISPNGRNNAQT